MNKTYTRKDIVSIGDTIFEDYIVEANMYGTSFVCEINSELEHTKEKLSQVLMLFGDYSIVDEYEIWDENGNDEPIPNSFEKVYLTNLPYSVIGEISEEIVLSKVRENVRKYCDTKDDNEVDNIINCIRKDIPNSTNFGYMYMRGVIRLIFNEDLESKQFDDINDMLEVLKHNNRIAEQYDGDFNGLYFEELMFLFNDSIMEMTNNERLSINELNLKPVDDYVIVPVKTFDDARKFREYSEWCICESESDFKHYTACNQSFYIILKEGYELMESPQTIHSYKDEYGLSMIAVSVKANGRLATCTGRYNEGVPDNKLLNAVEISKLIGCNFYDHFKPHTLL